MDSSTHFMEKYDLVSPSKKVFCFVFRIAGLCKICADCSNNQIQSSPGSTLTGAPTVSDVRSFTLTCPASSQPLAACFPTTSPHPLGDGNLAGRPVFFVSQTRHACPPLAVPLAASPRASANQRRPGRHRGQTGRCPPGSSRRRGGRGAHVRPVNFV